MSTDNKRQSTVWKMISYFTGSDDASPSRPNTQSPRKVEFDNGVQFCDYTQEDESAKILAEVDNWNGDDSMVMGSPSSRMSLAQARERRRSTKVPASNDIEQLQSKLLQLQESNAEAGAKHVRRQSMHEATLRRQSSRFAEPALPSIVVAPKASLAPSSSVQNTASTSPVRSSAPISTTTEEVVLPSKSLKVTSASMIPTTSLTTEVTNAHHKTSSSHIPISRTAQVRPTTSRTQVSFKGARRSVDSQRAHKPDNKPPWRAAGRTGSSSSTGTTESNGSRVNRRSYSSESGERSLKRKRSQEQCLPTAPIEADCGPEDCHKENRPAAKARPSMHWSRRPVALQQKQVQAAPKKASHEDSQAIINDLRRQNTMLQQKVRQMGAELQRYKRLRLQ
uniref:Uncharacterized protein n=1 Tax=Eutreptiella gymnastica TaxID=73025 RepID=A0A7S1IU71_9EUGL|mmetsp:Transcript_43540/g.78287  ORF Transcript_43540/g.78287 Transcript_43540/m.78287 type:complete len:393 (+) Transcript_43540:34-1212(+)